MIWTFEKVTVFNIREYNEWKIFTRWDENQNQKQEFWVKNQKQTKKCSWSFLPVHDCWSFSLLNNATRSIFILHKENPMQVSKIQGENHPVLVLWASMIKTFLRVILFSSYFLCQLITGLSLCMVAFFSSYFTSHFNTQMPKQHI